MEFWHDKCFLGSTWLHEVGVVLAFMDICKTNSEDALKRLQPDMVRQRTEVAFSLDTFCSMSSAMFGACSTGIVHGITKR
jgi:hypothetical protein